jgi:hypothetical protein
MEKVTLRKIYNGRMGWYDLLSCNRNKAMSSKPSQIRERFVA